MLIFCCYLNWAHLECHEGEYSRQVCPIPEGEKKKAQSDMSGMEEKMDRGLPKRGSQPDSGSIAQEHVRDADSQARPRHLSFQKILR